MINTKDENQVQKYKKSGTRVLKAKRDNDNKRINKIRKEMRKKYRQRKKIDIIKERTEREK